LTVAVWPWLLSMLCFLMVVTYWPGLSLWLPQRLCLNFTFLALHRQAPTLFGACFFGGSVWHNPLPGKSVRKP
jgi:hypothetical protein